VGRPVSIGLPHWRRSRMHAPYRRPSARTQEEGGDSRGHRFSRSSRSASFSTNGTRLQTAHGTVTERDGPGSTMPRGPSGSPEELPPLHDGRPRRARLGLEVLRFSPVEVGGECASIGGASHAAAHSVKRQRPDRSRDLAGGEVRLSGQYGSRAYARGEPCTTAVFSRCAGPISRHGPSDGRRAACRRCLRPTA